MILFSILGLIACGGESPPVKSPEKPVDKVEVPVPPVEKTAVVRASPVLVATELNARPMMLSATVAAPVAAATPGGAPGPKTTFGLYVLALTWEPNFCCTHSSKGQCDNFATEFGGNHLTIHGLWPNFSDAEAAKAGSPYPMFCGDYASCSKNSSAACDPNPSSIPADMATYGPGYVTDNNFLADHEWPKHGSCTGLDSGTYFQAAITQLKSLPGDQGTPALLTDNIGGSVKRTDLAASFGNADAVMMSCDSSCNLMQVEVCFAHDANNMPTGLTSCPENATKTPYDNSCALNHCDMVNLQKAGMCPASGGGGSSAGGGSCNAANGQGPACTADDSCTEAGYLRCAKSGCCTTIPK